MSTGVAVAPWRRAVHILRSTAALTVFFLYLMLFMGPLQRLIVTPLVWLMPARRARILSRWIRFCARVTRAIVVRGAGVRISVEGVRIAESAVVVMNHQSVLDIPIALCEVHGPPALIPVRTRYRWGIPGISPFLRMMPYPFITQKRATMKQDLAEIRAGCARVAAGEASLVFFPEGHRSRSGEIGRFMPGGLTVTLDAARRPVYVIVGDGMWRARTMMESLSSLAGTEVRVRITGPFAPPERAEDIAPFIAGLRDRMVESLHQLRSDSGGDAAVARIAESAD
ncbi:MAG TPA: 1-acyl-sn-glycerol-3-phosphate acyltransferase [Gemmatimonadaceae bacterium]|nr:1-acyl-sn-glycerol-3-phosphate acyltransferase [Gemmatimonadaceae bacterium]